MILKYKHLTSESGFISLVPTIILAALAVFSLVGATEEIFIYRKSVQDKINFVNKKYSEKSQSDELLFSL